MTTTEPIITIPEPPLRRICGWCKCELPGSNPDNPKVSHGICGPCVEKHFPDTYTTKKDTTYGN